MMAELTFTPLRRSPDARTLVDTINRMRASRDRFEAIGDSDSAAALDRDIDANEAYLLLLIEQCLGVSYRDLVEAGL